MYNVVFSHVRYLCTLFRLAMIVIKFKHVRDTPMRITWCQEESYVSVVESTSTNEEEKGLRPREREKKR